MSTILIIILNSFLNNVIILLSYHRKEGNLSDMSDLQEKLIKWADELERYKTPDWDSLPDIDLYMDQVITWLERQMSIISSPHDDKSITPAMINNYVKSRVIPRPLNKKYTREHLCYMMAILNLKQVLSLSDIPRLLSQITSDKSVRDLFDEFISIQDEILRQTSVKLRDALESMDENINEEEAEKRLGILVLRLSLESNAYRIAAKKILSEIIASSAKRNEKDKEKANSKGKDKEG